MRCIEDGWLPLSGEWWWCVCIWGAVVCGSATVSGRYERGVEDGSGADIGVMVWIACEGGRLI